MKEHYIILECKVCCTQSKHRIGYIGTICNNCGVVLCDEWLGSLARKRREYLKMSRRQIADKLGYKIGTIQRYEFVQCSRKYYNKLEELIKRGVK